MKFSIAIPTHDRGPNGPKWMRELLTSLKGQTLQDFDIVVSDQSPVGDDRILETCKEFSDDFEFTYIRYTGPVACENINTALKECTGEIVKIMFSDDIFITDKALEIIADAYDSTGCKWAFSGFCEMTEDGSTLWGHKEPKWSKYTLEGNNTLSSPSVVSFRNDSKLYFDEFMKQSLDVEFYHRMRWENGMPHIISDVLVANRGHSGRVGNTTYDTVLQTEVGQWHVKRAELEYTNNKYKEFLVDRKYPDEK